jgi:hypothetical protein
MKQSSPQIQHNQADFHTNFKLENLPTDLEDLIANKAEKIRSFGVANPISEVTKS